MEQNNETPEKDDAHILLFDEGGEWGYKDESSKFVLIAVSDIVNRGDFALIALKYPWNTRKGQRSKNPDNELKFSSSSDEIRRAVVDHISREDIAIHTVARKKDENDPDKAKRGSKKYLEIFEDVAKNVIEHTPAKRLYAYIDQTDNLRGDIGCEAIRKIAARYGKEVIECKKVVSAEHLLMQPHDFVAGSFVQFHEYNDPSYIYVLKDSIRTMKIFKK